VRRYLATFSRLSTPELVEQLFGFRVPDAWRRALERIAGGGKS